MKVDLLVSRGGTAQLKVGKNMGPHINRQQASSVNRMSEPKSSRIVKRCKKHRQNLLAAGNLEYPVPPLFEAGNGAITACEVLATLFDGQHSFDSLLYPC